MARVQSFTASGRPDQVLMGHWICQIMCYTTPCSWVAHHVLRVLLFGWHHQWWHHFCLLAVVLWLSAFSWQKSLWFALQLMNNLDAYLCPVLTRVKWPCFFGRLWFLVLDHLLFLFCFFQVCQISVQPPVNGELILRFQQLQSRLATLKIENEEVE